jgi:hypothetical protein
MTTESLEGNEPLLPQYEAQWNKKHALLCDAVNAFAAIAGLCKQAIDPQSEKEDVEFAVTYLAQFLDNDLETYQQYLQRVHPRSYKYVLNGSDNTAMAEFDELIGEFNKIRQEVKEGKMEAITKAQDIFERLRKVIYE